jgi:hypothetical protein
LQTEKGHVASAAFFFDIGLFDIGVGQDSPGKRLDEIA